MKEWKKERRRAVSTGSRSLILPGKTGKLFPNSPNQNKLHSYEDKGQEEYNTVDNKMVLQPEIQHIIIVGIY